MNEISLFLGSIFINNIVLAQFLGICSFLGVSKNLRSALGMGAAVSFVVMMSSILGWTIYHFCLKPLGLEYLKTLVFILSIAALVSLVEMFIKRYFDNLYKNMGLFLPLITTNCIILGVVLINAQKNYTFVQSLLNSAGTALGYTLAIVLFALLRRRLEESDIPVAMQGLPIGLVTAGCMAIALMGLTGLH